MIAIAGVLVALVGIHLLTSCWWWIVLVPALYGAALGRSTGRSALVGGAAAGLAWSGAALYALVTDADLVAARVAALMGLPWPWLLVLATGAAAALVAALAGAAGHAVRAALWPRRPG